MVSTSSIRIARVYDCPAYGDGHRVLVDGAWPRALSRRRASIDEWCREVAPSAGLGRWYGSEAASYQEFARRYVAELAGPGRSAAFTHLRGLAEAGPLTLLTAARPCEISHAAVLARLLTEPPTGPY